jgi:enamine deaminase RidA (YjgF/YER057c/UK114 family)
VTRHIVFTPKAAKPPPTYSQAVKAAGLVFLSGTAPTDPTTNAILGTTIQEQTRQCLVNIQAILEAAGSSLDKIVSATVVLADEDESASASGRQDAGSGYGIESIHCGRRRGLTFPERTKPISEGVSTS